MSIGWREAVPLRGDASACTPLTQYPAAATTSSVVITLRTVCGACGSDMLEGWREGGQGLIDVASFYPVFPSAPLAPGSRIPCKNRRSWLVRRPSD